jgi:hypothetical protein
MSTQRDSSEAPPNSTLGISEALDDRMADDIDKARDEPEVTPKLSPWILIRTEPGRGRKEFSTKLWYWIYAIGAAGAGFVVFVYGMRGAT